MSCLYMCSFVPVVWTFVLGVVFLCWEAAVKVKFVHIYIEYLLPVVRVLFKSSLSCILRSVKELCITPDKRIKPQSVLTSTHSMKNHHAVVTCWPCAMYQTDLTSYAALWLLYETNLLSSVAWRPLYQTNLPLWIYECINHCLGRMLQAFWL